ncbi:MAG TPA: hypothetical protein VKI40_06820 [Terriglobales bacterium]|nr:hypothetical protein [Terriglobales bacterium]
MNAEVNALEGSRCFHLLTHRLEVSLYSIHANQDAVDEEFFAVWLEVEVMHAAGKVFWSFESAVSLAHDMSG